MTRMPRSYDDWKLATPPEYEEMGEDPADPRYCEACGGEGRIYRTRSGSPSDPDVIDCGPCVYCDAGIVVAPKPPVPVEPKKPREPPPPIDDFVPF